MSEFDEIKEFIESQPIGACNKCKSENTFCFKIAKGRAYDVKKRCRDCQNEEVFMSGVGL